MADAYPNTAKCVPDQKAMGGSWKEVLIEDLNQSNQDDEDKEDKFIKEEGMLDRECDSSSSSSKM